MSRVIRYGFPYKAIFKDTDCSVLTGNGGVNHPFGAFGSSPEIDLYTKGTGQCWYTATWKHNEHLENEPLAVAPAPYPGVQQCYTKDSPATGNMPAVGTLIGSATGSLRRIGGMLCNHPIRRLVMHNYTPNSLNHKDLWIMRNDDFIY